MARHGEKAEVVLGHEADSADPVNQQDRHRLIESLLVADKSLQQIADRRVDQSHDRRASEDEVGELEKLPHEEVRCQRADENRQHDQDRQPGTGHFQRKQSIEPDKCLVEKIDRQGNGKDDDQAAQEVLYDPVHGASVARADSIASTALVRRSPHPPEIVRTVALNSSSASQNCSCRS